MAFTACSYSDTDECIFERGISISGSLRLCTGYLGLISRPCDTDRHTLSIFAFSDTYPLISRQSKNTSLGVVKENIEAASNVEITSASFFL